MKKISIAEKYYYNICIEFENGQSFSIDILGITNNNELCPLDEGDNYLLECMKMKDFELYQEIFDIIREQIHEIPE